MTQQRYITYESLQSFKQYLEHEEKSPLTVDKYMRDMKAFFKESIPCSQASTNL